MLKQVKLLGIAVLVGTTLVGCSNTNDSLDDLPLNDQIRLVEEAGVEAFNNLSPEEQYVEIEGAVDRVFNAVKPEIFNDNWVREYGESGKAIEDFATDKANEASEKVYQMIEEDGNTFGITKEQVCGIAGQEVYNEIMNYYNDILLPQEQIENERKEREAERKEEPERVYNAIVNYATQEYGECYIDKECINAGYNQFSANVYADPEFNETIGYVVIDLDYQLVEVGK